jgi:hypothetical protein
MPTDKLFTDQQEMCCPDWRSRVEGAGLGVLHCARLAGKNSPTKANSAMVRLVNNLAQYYFDIR